MMEVERSNSLVSVAVRPPEVAKTTSTPKTLRRECFENKARSSYAHYSTRIESHWLPIVCFRLTAVVAGIDH